jgi:hypothetical protein
MRNSTEENGSRVDVTVHIAKVIQAIQEVCVILRIQAAFQRRGFGVDTSVVLTRTVFGEDQLHNNKGFDEIWRIGYQLEKQLSRRGQAMLCGIVNERFPQRPSIKPPTPRHGSLTFVRFLTNKENCRLEFSESYVRIKTLLSNE